MLCRALGGKVGKAETGWDIGVRKVEIMESSEWRFTEEMGEIPSSLSIIECHQDEVWEIPYGAQVIGFSEKTGVEIFAIGDHILGIQGHPEYSKDILYNLVDRLLNNDTIQVTVFQILTYQLSASNYNFNSFFYLVTSDEVYDLLKREFAEDAKLGIQTAEPDTEWWEKICKNFLKGTLMESAL